MLKNTDSHFPTLIFSFHLLVQSVRMLSASCNFRFASSRFSSDTQRARSSANNDALTPGGNWSRMSLMKRRNISGDITDPWGVPALKRRYLLFAFSNRTLVRRSSRNDLIHLTVHIGKPLFNSLCMSPGCQTVSNALEKSIRHSTVRFPGFGLFSPSDISCVIFKTWSWVERKCLNPACSGLSVLLVSSK